MGDAGCGAGKGEWETCVAPSTVFSRVLSRVLAVLAAIGVWVFFYVRGGCCWGAGVGEEEEWCVVIM